MRRTIHIVISLLLLTPLTVWCQQDRSAAGNVLSLEQAIADEARFGAQFESRKVDTFPGLKLKGHVEEIAPASGSQFALLPPDNASGKRSDDSTARNEP